MHRWRNLEEYISEKKSDFHILFGLWTEKLQTFTGKNLNRNFEKHSTCPEDYLQSNFFWKRYFKNLAFKDFKWSFTESGENFFQGCQNCNNCPEEQIEEKPFRIEKKCNFFQDSERTLFVIFSVEFLPSCQNCNQPILAKLWGKTFFEALDIVSNLFGLWAKKRPLVEKVLPGLSQLPSARP